MITKQSIKKSINGLVYHRFDIGDLKDTIQKAIGVEVGDLSTHYIDGKYEGVDDYYSIDVEYKEGKDVYINVYFFPTNEDDIIFISEVSIDFDDWK